MLVFFFSPYLSCYTTAITRKWTYNSPGFGLDEISFFFFPVNASLTESNKWLQSLEGVTFKSSFRWGEAWL